MNRSIKKVAVLGSGVMGSRIACHFANTGIQVLLLDIVPNKLSTQEEQSGLTLDHPRVRNRIVNQALEQTLKSKPSSVYLPEMRNLITCGNLEDHLSKIAECDWIIEAIIEQPAIKQSLYEKVEQYRKTGTIISSNTSGIPISVLTQNRSDDFKKHFCGTHFFNPVRYLPLLEIIPGNETEKELINFLVDFGTRYLGKDCVICKDSPAFIANRIGVYSIVNLFHFMSNSSLTIEDVDILTGTVFGRPKSATFRTCDVVGLDTLVFVAEGLHQHAINDERREEFNLPSYVQQMKQNNQLGDKSGKGFYFKTKNESGKKAILSLDLTTLEYTEQKRKKIATIESAKAIDDLKDRIRFLVQTKDDVGKFYRHILAHLFAYSAHRVGEICDDFYQIDDAMKSGFGWQLGPFELWDCVGFDNGRSLIKEHSLTEAKWIGNIQENKSNAFYQLTENQLAYFATATKSYERIPGRESKISLSILKQNNVVWNNSGASLIDIGNDVVNLEFHTKMNTVGGEILNAINQSIDIAEKNHRGMVIANEGMNFSAGANLGLVFMMAVEQEFDEIDFAVRSFQNASMKIKYSSVPVVLAPHSLSLGGACEFSMHSAKVVAAAETYMGLVEVGVGLIPAGGGTKEFALRLSEEISEGDIELNQLKSRFLTIAMAKVSTSGLEAFNLGYLRKGIDQIEINRSLQIFRAKESVIALSESGYVKPSPKPIKIMGNTGLGMVYAGANSMLAGNYISEYDLKISQKLGYALCGGDLPSGTHVNEQYLLDLERKAFLSLCTEKKTLERIQSILTSGKPLRN
ncbi:MAG TPA: 3-hydroxyacyl-CoA dehydrogenase NAD-binding domain-containing protein [Bacteroidia bacterium]|nr:3-hydroxyacyl-CoA dehydrogenase NAD-binding domain-containing protein [Bacteroidia bacterium]